MSKVEDLEITSSYLKFQIGARVLEVEEVPFLPFQQHHPEPINNPHPVPEHIYFPALAPILNQILAAPHPIPESVPVQLSDSPAPIPIPSRIAYINSPNRDHIWETQSFHLEASHSTANSSLSSNRFKTEELSEHSRHPSRDQNNLERQQGLIFPETIPSTFPWQNPSQSDT